MSVNEMVPPGEIWSFWSTELEIVTGLTATGALYALGVGRLWADGRRQGNCARRRRRRPYRTRRSRGLHRRHALAFYAGLVMLAFALVSPLDALAGTLFSAHMIQHLVLLIVSSALLVYGRPVLPVVLALPRSVRRGVNSLRSSRVIEAAARVVTNPLVAWALGAAVLWAWHLPSLYEAALTNELVHALEHAMFLATGVLFWAVVLAPERAHGARIAFVFATALSSAALGAILTFSSTALYEVHGAGAHLWGLTPLQDQQLAGVIMWIPAGFVYLVTMAALFVPWFARMESAGPAPSTLRLEDR
jgi:putative membrane protein